MKLKEIRLKNFRCYENLTVPLHENLTVLVAPNGQGKTAILDAISIALWDFVKKFDLAKPNPAYNIGINKDDIRIVQDQRTELSQTEIKKVRGGMIRLLPTEIIATDTDNFSWKRYRDSEEVKSQTKADSNARKLQTRAENLQHNIRDLNLPFQTLPLFAYYGTGRLWDEIRLTEQRKHNQEDALIRTFAYRDSLNPASNYRQFEDWFTKKSLQLSVETISLYEEGKSTSELKTDLERMLTNIRNTIEIMLKIVGWKQPKYSQIFEAIVLSHEKYGTLKLEQLSDGIQNIFGMVADIAYRCYLLNPHLGEYATQQTEGIVLIDEVDMHLHPEWQQVILRDLQLAFPKLQFIVTTHSPQVLTTVPAECIRIINEQQIYYAPAGTKGAESSRLLERIFNVESRPPQDENTKMLAEYRQLVYVDKWADERAKELRKKLDEIFRGNEPELTALDLYIDNREWELSLEENQ